MHNHCVAEKPENGKNECKRTEENGTGGIQVADRDEDEERTD